MSAILLEADADALDALEKSLTGEAICASVLCRVLVTHLETDRRLTLSDTDTDVASRTVVEEWVVEWLLTVSDVELTHYTNLFSADLTSVRVLLAEASRCGVTLSVSTLVSEEAARTSLTATIGEDVTCTGTEAETVD
jgi:hypothetical protein